jgi:hypothetical protein
MLFPIALFIVAGLWIAIAKRLRESKCDHTGEISETSACNAICRNCGKNLGFIGSRNNDRPR